MNSLQVSPVFKSNEDAWECPYCDLQAISSLYCWVFLDRKWSTNSKKSAVHWRSRRTVWGSSWRTWERSSPPSSTWPTARWDHLQFLNVWTYVYVHTLNSAQNQWKDLQKPCVMLFFCWSQWTSSRSGTLITRHCSLIKLHWERNIN